MLKNGTKSIERLKSSSRIKSKRRGCKIEDSLAKALSRGKLSRTREYRRRDKWSKTGIMK